MPRLHLSWLEPHCSLQRVLAVRVDVDDDASLLIERHTSSSNDGGGDDRVLDGRQSVVVKVLGLGFSLVDLDAVGRECCRGQLGSDRRRYRHPYSPSLDPSAQADVTVSSLTVKGTIGSGRVFHVEAASWERIWISGDDLDPTSPSSDSRVVSSSTALISTNLVPSSSLVDHDFSLHV